MTDAETVLCPHCQATIEHPMDVYEGYCPRCRTWIEDRHPHPRLRHYNYDGQPISLREWAELFAGRQADVVRWKVDETEISDNITVSTVWDGLDHNWFGEGPPLIFESMVFGGPLHHETRRYSSAEEAQAGHDELVDLIRLELAARETPSQS